MENKRFAKNDEGFICRNCGESVGPLKYSSRNHCPFCMHSVHFDIMPGDRLNDCGGILEPFFTRPDAKKGWIITFKCLKCGKQLQNKSANDDNRDLLIKLTNPYNYHKPQM